MRRKIVMIGRGVWDELLAIDEAFAPADVLITSVCLFLLIAAVDWLTGYELSLNPFYLLLVMFVAWRCGWKWALAFALGAQANEVAIGLVSGNPFATVFYFVVAHFERLFSSLVIIGLLAQLRTLRGNADDPISENR